jgi:N-acetylglucosamine-6-sulfatase
VFFSLVFCIFLVACGAPDAGPPSGADQAAEQEARDSGSEAAEAARPEAAASTTPSPAERPNVLIVVVDDLRWDEFGAAGHQYLETPNIDRLAAEGAMFLNSFHAVPLCSPNRASLLTGQYPSRHGIIDNVARNRASHRLQTFPIALQDAGYETGYIGKWHMGNDPTPRPGFDYWVALPGQGRTINPFLYEDGRIQEVEGYVTDVLTDRAVEFIERERSEPFLLYIAHKAIHPDARQLDDGSVDPDEPSRFIPAPRHEGRYANEVLERRPNFLASPDELVDKPALQAALRYRESAEIAAEFGQDDMQASDENIRGRAEMLLAVDEGLGRLLEALEATGRLDETMVVFSSENGYFYGEHALSLERRMPYEEGIRNPLLVRYPPLVPAGSRMSELVSSVDLAPTVLEAAGAPIGSHIQGRSYLPLLVGGSRGTAADAAHETLDAAPWRQSLLIEFYTFENPFPWLMDMDYRAVRTDRYKYIHWMQHPADDELYDLEADPYEMVNLAYRPEMAEVRRELRAELARLVLEVMGLGQESP